MRWSRGISAVQYCTGSESFPIMSCLMCFRTGELLRFSPLEKSHVADLENIWRADLPSGSTGGRDLGGYIMNSDTPSSNTIMCYISLLASALLLLPLIACSGTGTLAG